MHNAEECLAKAAEMETLARTCDPEIAVTYRAMATHWRYLAHNAQVPATSESETDQ
jgi:hypothetical protein